MKERTAMTNSFKQVCAGLAALALLAPVGFGHAQGAKPRELKLAFQTNAGTAQYDGMEKFAEIVKNKGGGKLAVNLFGGGGLGGDLQVVSRARHQPVAQHRAALDQPVGRGGVAEIAGYH
jgi:TRAP-type C4-dicarboxylate transport system substrate-binding protein